MALKQSSTLSDFFSLMCDRTELGEPLSESDAGQFQKLFVKRLSRVRKRAEKFDSGLTLLSSVGWPQSDCCGSELPRLLNEVKLADRKSHRKAAVDALIHHVTTHFEVKARMRACGIVVSAELALRFAERFQPSDLWNVVQRIQHLDAEELADEAAAECHDDQQAVWRLITLGEIPVVRSLLLGLLDESQAAADMSAVEEQLNRMTDTDGVPSAAIVHEMTAWIAATTRAAWWSRCFKSSWTNTAIGTRWKRLVKCAVRMLTPVGFVTRMSDDNAVTTVQICEVAVRLAGVTGATARLVERIQAAQQKSRKSKTRDRSKTEPGHSYQSDWGETALMRTGLHAGSDVLQICWNASDRGLPLHLFAGHRPLLAGHWTSRVAVNGAETSRDLREWTCTCWFEDRDAAFVELESTTGELHCVRHVLLSIPDQFAVLTESVAAKDPSASLTLSTEIDTATTVTATRDEVTREWLTDPDSAYTRLLPAWLSDDRAVHASGTFDWQPGCLRMSAEGTGGLTMPLVIDWDSGRRNHPADWTPLTVTEDRTVINGSAAGFRVRVGTFQLLIYRSLQPSQTLRAVLGQHTNRETMYGHVRNSGAISPIVMVDSEI